jgi:hypothetical protein
MKYLYKHLFIILLVILRAGKIFLRNFMLFRNEFNSLWNRKNNAKDSIIEIEEI